MEEEHKEEGKRFILTSLEANKWFWQQVCFQTTITQADRPAYLTEEAPSHKHQNLY